MKLPFEEWITNKNFSLNVQTLFNEAFICYRNSAYRASLLFSYLGFLTNLKEVIIKSTKPKDIVQSSWDKIISYLQNDDTWEKTVFESLINSSSPIFNINEDIRQQIKYWKDRRNDCAHFKSNEIESHHTESFWSFIKSNLFKITIEGGAETLLKKIEKHFDPTFTPPNRDFSDLIKEIDEAVDFHQLNDFWDKLIKITDEWGFIFIGESNATKVVKSILENCDSKTIESLIDYLKSNEFDLTIIALYPEKVNLMNYSSEEIRKIWRTRIFKNTTNTFALYGTLLRNSLIPSEEINEAHEHIINNLKNNRPEDDKTHESLNSNGFGVAMFNLVIEKHKLAPFLWVNDRADMIAYYIEKYPLQKETVKLICEMYTWKKYSWWLEERLVNNFKESPTKKAEFHQIANSNGFTIPNNLI